jgi:hypothetical protein
MTTNDSHSPSKRKRHNQIQPLLKLQPSIKKQATLKREPSLTLHRSSNWSVSKERVKKSPQPTPTIYRRLAASQKKSRRLKSQKTREPTLTITHHIKTPNKNYLKRRELQSNHYKAVIGLQRSRVAKTSPCQGAGKLPSPISLPRFSPML